MTLLAGGPALADCRVSVTPMAFGLYVAEQTTALDASSSVSLDCDKNNEFVTVQLTPAGGSTRSMQLGADALRYQVYADTTRTQVFTQTSLRVHQQKNTGILTLYGRVFANQNVSPGSYAATLSVNVLP